MFMLSTLTAFGENVEQRYLGKKYLRKSILPWEKKPFYIPPIVFCHVRVYCTLWILNMWGTFCACLKKHRMCGWKARGGTFGVYCI